MIKIELKKHICMALKFNIYINQTPLQQSPIQIKEQSRIKESNFEEEMSILKSQVNPSSSCGYCAFQLFPLFLSS